MIIDKNKLLNWSLIVVLAIIFIAMLSDCVFNGEDNIDNGNDTITTTDTVYHFSTIHDTIYTPTPHEIIYVHTTDTLTKTDTVFIVRDYFAKVHYVDTLINNDSMFFVINDTVQKNRIYSREYMIKYRYPQVNTTTTIVKHSNGLYVGCFLNGSKDYLDYGPQVMYVKKKWAYNAGFGINNKSLYIGVNYKLK